MKKIISLVVGTLLLTVMTVTGANSAQTLKCQTVISAKADEVKMLKDFTDTVTELTQGSLKFEIMPAGAVVGVKETLDAVDKVLSIVVLLGLTIGQVITQQLCYLVHQ